MIATLLFWFFPLELLMRSCTTFCRQAQKRIKPKRNGKSSPTFVQQDWHFKKKSIQLNLHSQITSYFILKFGFILGFIKVLACVMGLPELMCSTCMVGSAKPRSSKLSPSRPRPCIFHYPPVKTWLNCVNFFGTQIQNVPVITTLSSSLFYQSK